jgi:predicted Fe-Mo cluster-binding NifX family protein
MRVSPVFDTCTRILIVDIETGREIDRKELYLNALSLTERMMILRKTGVHTVICGGISDTLANMLSGAKFTLVSNISGEIDQVLAAFLAESLDDARFLMPGARADFHPTAMPDKE